MVQFFILAGASKRTCTATDAAKAAEILRLMFNNSKGYVIENNKVTFSQNMTIEEAEISHGIKKMQSMEVLPVAPKAAKVKRIATAVGMTIKKPVKSKAKKTTLKSKVVLKNKKSATKKTVVKSKVKPKAKKKPVAKVKVKGKKR